MTLSGLAVLTLTVVVMLVRGIDTVEVVAVALYVPVFLALVWRDGWGGAAAAVLATAVYAAMRQPATDAIGGASFRDLVLVRGAAYLAFGVVGGLANHELRRSLTKLDANDEVDDATGLGNARHLLMVTDLEVTRAARYRTLFSLVSVEVQSEALATLPRRRRRAVVHRLGEVLRSSVRTVDHPVHAWDGRGHHFAVVLPETGELGARTLADRLAACMIEELAGGGAPAEAEGAVTTAVLTHPGDDERLAEVCRTFSAIDAVEHPEHPTASR